MWRQKQEGVRLEGMRVIVNQHPCDSVGDSGIILEAEGLWDYEYTVVRTAIAEEVLS